MRQDMSANVRPVTRVTVAPDAWRLRSELAATLTLIVQIMPSVERIGRADAGPDLKQSIELISSNFGQLQYYYTLPVFL